MVDFQFNAHEHAPNVAPPGNLPVSPPEGWVVQIVAVHKTDTNARDGWFFEFVLQIVDGPNQGATGSYRLNYGNNSEQAVNIAIGQLSTLCHVTGVMMIQHQMEELLNIPFRVIVVMQVGAEAAEKGWTTIQDVLDIHGNAPKHNAASVPQAATGAPQFAVEQGAPAPQSQIATEAAQAAEGFAGPPQQQQGWGQQPQAAPAQQQQPPQQQQQPTPAPAGPKPPWG